MKLNELHLHSVTDFKMFLNIIDQPYTHAINMLVLSLYVQLYARSFK